MWPLPSSAAIPVGDPFAGLSLVEAFAVVMILLAGAIVFYLARLSWAGREVRIVQCPLDGTRARTLVGRSSAKGPLRVVYCSRWRVHAATCDRNCVPKAA